MDATSLYYYGIFSLVENKPTISKDIIRKIVCEFWNVAITLPL